VAQQPPLCKSLQLPLAFVREPEFYPAYHPSASLPSPAKPTPGEAARGALATALQGALVTALQGPLDKAAKAGEAIQLGC
jgi:hypothetical protein